MRTLVAVMCAAALMLLPVVRADANALPMSAVELQQATAGATNTSSLGACTLRGEDCAVGAVCQNDVAAAFLKCLNGSQRPSLLAGELCPAGCKKSKLMRRVGSVCVMTQVDTTVSTRLNADYFRRLQDCVAGGNIAQNCRRDPNILEAARLAGCVGECIEWFQDTLDRGLICAAAGQEGCDAVQLPPCGAPATLARAEALAPLAATSGAMRLSTFAWRWCALLAALAAALVG